MKKLLVLMSLAVLGSTVASAHKHDFGVSVYDLYDRLPYAGKRIAAQSQQRAKALFPSFNVVTDKLTGLPRDIYGYHMNISGNTLSEKSQHIINNQLQSFELRATDWQKANEVNAPHASFVHYKQVINNHPVVFSQLSFRYTKDGLLQRIVLKTYGQPQAGVQPLLSRSQIAEVPGMTTALSAVNITSKTIDNDWVWFPVPTQNGYVLRPAWPFTVSGTDVHDEAMPVQLTGYADAIDGAILYRTNEVKHDLDLTVKGEVFKASISTPATLEPLANLAIVVNSNTGYTNDTGYYFSATPVPPQNAAVRLQGRWSTIRTGAAGGAIPSFNHTIAANGTTYVYPNTAPSGNQFVNGYYHTDRMHEFMKKFYPTTSGGFTGLDVALTTVIDISSTTGCNAFYNGTSINFFTENASCHSFANVNSVVYHEYGHGINGRFYGYIKGSGGMINGGLNEGYADVWAMGLTRDPVIGRDGFKNGGNIRTYNTPPKVYPEDRNSEVHANGEIIAGSWWDYGTYVNSIDSMSALFAKTLYDVPDGPEGTEGEVYHEVLVSAVVNDDDDANLTNGTPHFKEITAAFAAHGIFLMMDAKLDHKEIAHRAIESEPIDIKANIIVSEPAYFKSMKVIYKSRIASNWDTITLSNTGVGATGGQDFAGQIPPQPAGSIIDYYFQTYDIFDFPAYSFPNGFNGSKQLNQTTIPYQFAIALRRFDGTDFETPANGWTLGGIIGDITTNGKWVQAVPIASFWRPSGVSPYIQQPGFDAGGSPGTCLITGNASSANSDYAIADVDGGKTTAISPVIDVSGAKTPIIEYYRWYGNDQGGRSSNPRSDFWQVQIRDANSPLWINVDFTYQSDYNWRRKIFYVRDYLATSTQIQVRFIATDAVISSMNNNGENVVEAGVDDFSVYDAWTTSIEQTTKNNSVSVYPNPANDVLTIMLDHGMNGTIQLTDITGRILKQLPTNNQDNTYTISTATLVPGTYLLQVQNDKLTHTQRIAVTH